MYTAAGLRQQTWPFCIITNGKGVWEEYEPGRIYRKICSRP